MHGNLPIGIAARLCQSSLFAGLSGEAISNLSRGTREIHITKGATLFRKGERCNGIHLVMFGSVKLYFPSTAGSEKVSEILSAGDSCGEDTLFSLQPYVTSGEALSDTLLLHVPRSAIFDELGQNWQLTQRMLTHISQRTQRLLGEVESFALQNGRERIIRYLLTLATPTADDAEPDSFVLPTFKSVIASQLNLTQEHFSRLLNELQTEGLICIQGRRIGIPSHTRLRNAISH